MILTTIIIAVILMALCGLVASGVMFIIWAFIMTMCVLLPFSLPYGLMTYGYEHHYWFYTIIGGLFLPLGLYCSFKIACFFNWEQ